MMSTIFLKKVNQPGIIRISQRDNFPMSIWCVRKKSMYCLISHQKERKIDILKFPELSKN